MDVLLIDPPYYSLKGVSTDCGYNVGLTSLAAYLRSHGIETAVLSGDLLTELPGKEWDTYDLEVYASAHHEYAKIVNDKNYDIWKKISDIVKSSNPRLVGITYYTPLKNVVERIAGLVKEIDPAMKVAVGAFHPTYCTEEVMSNPDIDFAVRGEGEIPLLSLIREVKKDNPKWETVPSLHYRDKDGLVRKNNGIDLIENLDDLPFLARDLVINCDYDTYRDHCLTSARGCPYSCSFCGEKRLWGGKVRRRSIDNVIEEIKLINDSYNANFIDFMDGTFTFDRKYLTSFCNRLIDEKLNIKWRCTARYDNLDEDLLKLLKRANCFGFFFGLETGSDRMLKSIDKRITTQEILKIDEMVYKYGFFSITSIILGIPGETKEDIENTLGLMKQLKTPDLDVNSFIPLPGTVLYDSLEKEVRENIDWRKVAMKSLDNYFLKTMSFEEFKGYLLEAYKIVNDSRGKNTIASNT